MYSFAPGSTGKSIHFFLRDSVTGQPKSGLAYNSGGARAGYCRSGGSAAAVSLSSLSSPTSAWVAGGFVEIDATNTPGLYRLDLPDAALAAGCAFVSVTLGFNGALGEGALVQLVQPANLAGAGGTAWVVTINGPSGPLPQSSVWVTTDQAGTNVIAGTLTTNDLGQATFYLDAGTYYLWTAHNGYQGTNPTAFTVS